MKKELSSRNNLGDLFYKGENKRPLILDGAMGSYLQSLGHKRHNNLWFSHLNVSDPASVVDVHKSYIEAGADIITTNTFRTNPYAAAGTEYRFEDLVYSAVKNAKAAVGTKDILIAGSNPPAEDSYREYRTLSQKEIEENHSKHIELLYQNGCDFILNETQSHLDEIKFICAFCSDKTIPFVISLFIKEDLRILSGENLTDIISIADGYNPLAISFNCINQTVLRKLMNEINLTRPWGFYLNYGTGNFDDEEIKHVYAPGSEKDLLKFAVRKDVSFIGGCCGSGPKHITHIRKDIDGIFKS